MSDWAAFGVAVHRRHSDRAGTARSRSTRGRDRLGEFDWVVLAAPSTDATRAMIGAPELAAMKRSAWLVNIARGD